MALVPKEDVTVVLFSKCILVHLFAFFKLKINYLTMWSLNYFGTPCK